MLNRRQAVVGYATYVLARRVARKAVRRKLEDLRPFAGANATEVVRERGGRMLKRSNGAGKAARRTKDATSAGVGRASALIEAVRPLVERAVSDQQLHAAIRNALATGRELSSQVSGKKPSKAARKLADDRKLQRRALASVTELRDAVSGVVNEPKRRSRRKLLGVLAALGAVAAAVPFLKNRLNGGGGEQGQNGGYAA